MSRLVKCQDTGESIDKADAYRADNGKYWSNEASYIKWATQKEWRQKCIELIFELLDFKHGQTVPTNLYSQLKKFENMGYDTVYDTIVDQRDQILWAIHNKEFKQTSSMIMYVGRILENHMMDVYKRRQEDKKREELQERTIIPENIEVDNKKQSTRDISRFLED